MPIDFEQFLMEMAQHDAKIDLQNCPHCCTNGDNNGVSCSHCGIQLKGYGYGGFFGSNLTGTEKCIHDFFECEDRKICRFCERSEPLTPEPEEISQSVH